MATISRAVTINIALVTVLLVLGLTLNSRSGPLMKEIRRFEAQTERRIGSAVKPANVLSSCSALVAVFFAWRSFTGYRRRVPN